jgi:DNA-binding SARP family transcriptional activator
MPRKPPPASSLEIHLLGPFRAVVDGVPVHERRWERRHAKLLVKVLALQHSQQLHREQLIDLLWPDEDLESAARNLHKVIHLARHALEPRLRSGAESRFILTHEKQVLLRAPGTMWIDAIEFERLATQALRASDPARHEAALALYADDLLIEDPYDDWAARPRERLRGLWRELLVNQAALLEGRGQYKEASACLARALEREPADEECHRGLMRLYALAGSRTAALEQYRLCREALARELGVEPEPSTEALHKQIDSGRLQAPPPAEPRAAPALRQLTFRRGWVQAARFAAAGEGVVFSAAWDGAELDLFRVEAQSLDARPLGLAGAGLLAAAPAGELAVSLGRRFRRGYVCTGTLALVTPDGGPARAVVDDVQWADSSADGAKLAIVREVAGCSRLEYPAGTVLYETGGWVSHARVAPGGDLVAFVDHMIAGDDGGEVAVVGADRQKRVLSGGWISAQGLAWSAGGEEVWFTATREGNTRALHAVTLGGYERHLYAGAGVLTLQDVARDGRALLTREHTRLGIVGRAPGQAEERDLSWHDWSLARDLSADGRLVLLTEAGEGGGAGYGAYVRPTDGAPACRLGEGSALALSPDGRWALTARKCRPMHLALLPVAGGEARPIAPAGLTYQPWACWFADGRRILFVATEGGGAPRLYVQDLAGGRPRVLASAEEGVELTSPHAISPDQQWVAAVGPDLRMYLYPVSGGAPRPVPEVDAGEIPVRWGADGASLFVRRRGDAPARLWRLELGDGRRALHAELMPAEKAGVHEILRMLLTAGGEGYAYTYTRELSDLYVVSGLR